MPEMWSFPIHKKNSTVIKRILHALYVPVFLAGSFVGFLMAQKGSNLFTWMFASFGVVSSLSAVFCCLVSLNLASHQVKVPKSLWWVFGLFMLGCLLIFTAAYFLSEIGIISESLSKITINFPGWIALIVASESIVFVAVAFPLWLAFAVVYWLTHMASFGWLSNRA